MSATFYRDQLKSAQAREFYDALCGSISRGNLGGIYPLEYHTRGTAIQDGFDAIRALHHDRPDFFFIGDKCEAMIRGDRLVLMNNVLYTPDQICQIRRCLDRTLDALSAGTAGLPDWERERIVYERVIRFLSYADHGTENAPKDYDHNIVGPLLQGSGVCEGFSCLLMLALRRVSIPCIRVSGIGKDQAHCWNMAWIDGFPAHLDITWDCVNEKGDVGFFYFNLTDEQITRDHKILTRGLPVCVMPTNGYHYRRGTVFSTLHEASGFFKTAFLRGGGPYCIRFTGELDIRSGIRKAMRHAPVLRYSYRVSDTQRTALVWGD